MLIVNFLNLSVAFKNTFWSKIQRNIMQIDNSRIINYDTFGVVILQNLQPLKHAVFKYMNMNIKYMNTHMIIYSEKMPWLNKQ